jgi:hypothetical protein
MSADPKAQHKLPFDLRPTSLKGVFSFVPPPRGTDLTKASQRTLFKHGIFMRPPDPDKQPKLFALWTRFLDIWTLDNFLEPTFGIPEAVPHNLKGGLRQTDGRYVGRGGWSGVVVVGSWVGAMGIWQVPTVTAPTTPVGPSGVWQSSSWVGLDGASGLIPGTTTTDVLQAGISQNYVSGTGQIAYYPWYEWVVADLSVVSEFPYVYPIQFTSIPVSAGDEISVVVQYVKQKGDEIGDPIPPAGPYQFGGVMLMNMTKNKGHSLYLAPPTGASFLGDSAEWIMECPDGLAGDSLPKFSSVTFHTAGACNVGDALPGGEIGIELQKADQVVFEDAEGVTETNVSADVGTVTITYNVG